MSTEIPKQLRADARRNRARVLEAADAVFAEAGLHAGIEEIAHRAGVGVGTVCRNFPTKEDLLAEVLTVRSEALLNHAQVALADPDPAAAFEGFLVAAAASAARYRALAEEMAARGDVPVRHGLKEEFRDALDRLLSHAQVAGVVRPDVTSADIKLILSGLAQAMVTPGEDRSREQFLRIVLDGLRPQTPPVDRSASEGQSASTGQSASAGQEIEHGVN